MHTHASFKYHWIPVPHIIFCYMSFLALQMQVSRWGGRHVTTEAGGGEVGAKHMTEINLCVLVLVTVIPKIMQG